MLLPPIEKMADTMKMQDLKTWIKSTESDREKITSNDMEESHEREIGWEKTGPQHLTTLQHPFTHTYCNSG